MIYISSLYRFYILRVQPADSREESSENNLTSLALNSLLAPPDSEVFVDIDTGDLPATEPTEGGQLSEGIRS